MKIDINEIEKIDLSRYKNLDNIDHNEFYGNPGKEHYKLLAYFSTLFENQTLIDIGSHRGSSAVALSYNKNNFIQSFDIENRIPDSINSPKTISNIKFNYVNLFNEEERKPWVDAILNSPLIFLDIDPHEGMLEYQFYLWLKNNNYSGVIIFDDIHYFEGMRNNLWDKIENIHKQDITDYGHWSGTGLVKFTNF